MHAYNFGGIKGVGPSGGSVVILTRLHVGEKRLVQRNLSASIARLGRARDLKRPAADESQ